MVEEIWSGKPNLCGVDCSDTYGIRRPGCSDICGFSDPLNEQRNYERSQIRSSKIIWMNTAWRLRAAFWTDERKEEMDFILIS